MAWVSNNVLWQHPEESFAAVVDALTARKPTETEFVHILNPFASSTGEVRSVQDRTTDSIRSARRHSPGVNLVAVVAGEQPGGEFDSVVRLGAASTVDNEKPRIFDLLQAGSSAPVAGDYIVFTNMDICVTPSFYAGVRELIAAGAEALIINRRTVHGWDTASPTAGLARYDLGDSHPGMDCFIFPRRWVHGFVTSPAVVGHGHVMRGLLYNLVVRAEPLVALTNVAMTYHYGDDRPWQSTDAAPHFAANKRAAREVYEQLAAQSSVNAERLLSFTSALPKYSPPG